MTDNRIAELKNLVEKSTTRNEYGDSVIRLTVGGKEFVWFDNAHVDYPEDLCWDRMISDVFWSGFEMGARAAMGENDDDL